MYHSYLLINVGDNPDRPDWNITRRWLRNLYHVHQRLCMAFPSEPRKERDPEFLAPYAPDDFPEHRHLADKKKTEVDPTFLKQVHSKRGPDSNFLFRIDPYPSGRSVILVQSAIEPDWDYAFHNAGYLLAARPEVKPFAPRFTKGQRLRFRLVANPTKKIDTIKKEERERCTKEELNGKQGRHGKRVPVPTDQLIDWLACRAESGGFSIDKGPVTIQPGYVYMKSRDDKGQRLRSVRYEGVLEVTGPAGFEETLIRGIGSGKAFGFGLLSVAPICAEVK